MVVSVCQLASRKVLNCTRTVTVEQVTAPSLETWTAGSTRASLVESDPPAPDPMLFTPNQPRSKKVARVNSRRTIGLLTGLPHRIPTKLIVAAPAPLYVFTP